MGAYESRDSAVACPAHRNTALRSTKSIGNATLTARQDERKWSRPMPRRQVRSITWQMRIETLQHLDSGDEQEERYANRRSRQLDQCDHRVAIIRSRTCVPR